MKILNPEETESSSKSVSPCPLSPIGHEENSPLDGTKESPLHQLRLHGSKVCIDDGGDTLWVYDLLPDGCEIYLQFPIVAHNLLALDSYST